MARILGISAYYHDSAACLVDPLRCTCGGTMRVVAFIPDPAVSRKILQHRPRTHAPPPG